MFFPRRAETPFILLIVILLYSMAVHADFNRGVFAYNNYDYLTARNEFKRAAVDGHAEAQHYLGEIYEGGIGVPIDYKQAYNWYGQAAKQEHAGAQARLALLYMSGLGVAHSSEDSFYWYLRSAENGYPLAQFEVGLMYAQGQGTPVSKIEAYRWLTIAASYGDPEAMGVRKSLAVDMTSAETSRASYLASEWEFAREKDKR
jgi:TPR repeat protein